MSSTPDPAAATEREINLARWLYEFAMVDRNRAELAPAWDTLFETHREGWITKAREALWEADHGR